MNWKTYQLFGLLFVLLSATPLPAAADPASDLQSIIDELRGADPATETGDHVVGEHLC